MRHGCVPPLKNKPSCLALGCRNAVPRCPAMDGWMDVCTSAPGRRRGLSGLLQGVTIDRIEIADVMLRLLKIELTTVQCDNSLGAALSSRASHWHS